MTSEIRTFSREKKQMSKCIFSSRACKVKFRHLAFSCSEIRTPRAALLQAIAEDRFDQNRWQRICQCVYKHTLVSCLSSAQIFWLLKVSFILYHQNRMRKLSSRKYEVRWCVVVDGMLFFLELQNFNPISSNFLVKYGQLTMWLPYLIQSLIQQKSPINFNSK